MSEYCTGKTEFRDADALVAALMETRGWTREQIEVHEEAQHLYGYHGDMRAQQAHVIIRGSGHTQRGLVNNVGGASNDIGYERMADGTYRSHISEYDRSRHGLEFDRALRRNYAFHRLRIQQESLGRTVERERVPGTERQVIRVRGYR